MLTGTEILTTAQMRAIEQAAMDSGKVTGLELMERAGAAVAGQIRLRWPKPGRVTVLCGPGNNGGDGYVVARLLHEASWRVRVLGMDNTPGPDAAEMKRRWRQMGEIGPLEMKALETSLPADLAVDALFGSGMTRPLGAEFSRLLNRLGGFTFARKVPRTPVVAVDAPSGLCMDSGAMIGRPRGIVLAGRQADVTISFHRLKIGHLIGDGPAYCGQIGVADIGLTLSGHPLHVVRQAKADVARLRKYAKGHKFNHGHALVLAGGAGHAGAARLAARAALRIGAGLVTICPPKPAMIEHSGSPDALMRREVDDPDALRRALDDPRIQAVCLGPGCGVDRATELLPILLAAGRPCVLDADAITALAGIGLDRLHDNCVLTPHHGEFARLFPDLAEQLVTPTQPPMRPKDPTQKVAHMIEQQEWHQRLADQRGPLFSKVDAAREAARRSGAVVLLKGPDTVIAEPPPRKRNDLPGRAIIHSAFDIPWLATAGAGDVLAGIITGLLARGLPPLDAAAAGALVHAAAARRFGPGLIADDLPEQIPGVFRDMNL